VQADVFCLALAVRESFNPLLKEPRDKKAAA